MMFNPGFVILESDHVTFDSDHVISKSGHMMLNLSIL